jgi:hypothetical protein
MSSCFILSFCFSSLPPSTYVYSLNGKVKMIMRFTLRRTRLLHKQCKIIVKELKNKFLFIEWLVFYHIVEEEEKQNYTTEENGFWRKRGTSRKRYRHHISITVML